MCGRDAAHTADLEEWEEDVVVARVQVEAGLLDDELRLDEVVVRLLDSFDRLDLGELGHRRRLDIDHDAAGDVVDDHRTVTDRRNGLEVLNDAARRRLRVVRGDNEEAVGTDRVRLLGEMDRFGRRVRAGSGDHSRPVADCADGHAEELEPLVLGQRRRLARGAGDDDAVRPVLDQVVSELGKAVEVDRAVRPKRRHDRGQNLSEHRLR